MAYAHIVAAFVVANPWTSVVFFFSACFAGWLVYMGEQDRRAIKRDAERAAMVRSANAQIVADAKRRAEQYPNVVVMPPSAHPIWRRSHNTDRQVH